MRLVATLSLAALLAVPAPAAEASKTYVGIMTDTMCKTDHAAMRVTPDTKCVRDCVGDGKTYKYAWTDGKVTYTLSDQESPAKFAGEKVKITGVLYAKTQILKVERIERVK